MSVANYALVSASLKKAIAASVVGVSAVAIPATAITVIPEKKDKFLDPIKKHSETLYKEMEGRVEEGTKKIWDSYSGTYKETSETMGENLKKLGKELKKGEEKISSITPYLSREYIDSYNYHAFTNREVINAAIKSFPTMIRDSIKDGISDGENYELLSFRKLYHIISHPNFKQMIGVLSELGSKRDQILSKTTKEDARGIIEIIRSLPFEEGTGQREDKSSPRITKFLREVTKHIKEINGDKTRSYETAKELVIDILTGKNTEKETKENLKKVIDQLKEKTQVLTEKVPVDSSRLEGAKAILEMLEEILKATQKQPQT